MQPSCGPLGVVSVVLGEVDVVTGALGVFRVFSDLILEMYICAAVWAS